MYSLVVYVYSYAVTFTHKIRRIIVIILELDDGIYMKFLLKESPDTQRYTHCIHVV